MGIVYCATNKFTGESYIGKTIHNLEIRGSNNWKSCPKFHKAIKDYGKLNFLFRILFESNIEKELFEREKFWIRAYNTIEEGYNLAEGGLRIQPCEEVRKRISQSLTGRHPSLETRKKMSLLKKGSSYSSERYKKLATKRSKKVRCSETGIIYESTMGVERKTGIVHQNIVNCCLNRQNTSHDFHWTYILNKD